MRPRCRSFYSGALRDEKVISEIKSIPSRNGPIEKMGIRARQQQGWEVNGARGVGNKKNECALLWTAYSVDWCWWCLMACRSNWSCAFPPALYNLISGIGAQKNGAIFCPRQPSRALAQTFLKTAFSKNKQAGNAPRAHINIHNAAHTLIRRAAIASSSLFVHTTTAFQLLIFNSPAPAHINMLLKPSSFS